MLTKQQIRKGASIVAQMQMKRHELAVMASCDMRYYRCRQLIGATEVRRAIKNRYRNDFRRALKPTIANLTREIKYLAERLAVEECPWYLPCGADDAWYEVRDSWRQTLKRWCQAYKFLRHMERTVKHV